MIFSAPGPSFPAAGTNSCGAVSPILAAVQLLRVLFVSLLFTASALADKKPVTALRWAEGEANCTVRAADDGHIYYGISSPDFDITMAVDRQELEKIPFRVVPLLGVQLTFHVKGTKDVEIMQNKFNLEFLKHFHLVENALDPDDLQHTIHSNMDDLTDEVEHHEVRKHPEQKEQKEAELQARLKQYKEMSDFIGTHTFRSVNLSPNASASGWVFFDLKNRWIGPWRKPEQFILRLSIENMSVEFPFQLPPKQGKLTLRHRPDKS